MSEVNRNSAARRQAVAGEWVFTLGPARDETDRFEQELIINGPSRIGIGPALPKVLSMFHAAKGLPLPEVTYTIETAMSPNPDGDAVLLIGAQERNRGRGETISAIDVATLAARALAGYMTNQQYTQIEFLPLPDATTEP